MGQLVDTADQDPQAEITLCELGQLGVRRASEWCSVGGERTSTFLATLAMGQRHSVRTEELLEAIWPSPSQTKSARQSLANIVSRLRSAYGATFIESDRSGYRRSYLFQ